MDYKLLFPSKYLKAADLGGKDFTLKIKSVRAEELEGEGGAKTKGLITFEGAKKAWVLNRTVCEALNLMWGSETSKWVGHQVTLYSKKVESFGEEVDAIRVRGSPELTKPLSATIPRGKKKIVVHLVPTGKTAAGSADQLAEPTPEDEAGSDLGDPLNPTPEELSESGAER